MIRPVYGYSDLWYLQEEIKNTTKVKDIKKLWSETLSIKVQSVDVVLHKSM